MFDLIFWCFNATFKNISAISWRPVLVVEEAGVPGENHRPWTSNWTLSGRWFSPGTPASSTTKTGRHDIAEIFLKVALKHQNQNQIVSIFVIAERQL
jgi:hypothetical protein